MPVKTSPFTPGAVVCAYLRDSGGDDQDLSVVQQEDVLTRWCADNHLHLIRIFRDVARPGSSTIGREAFSEMIAYFHAPACPAAGVVIWKYSRFARDIDDAQYYKADLRRRGFAIHSLNDSVPEGINGRFFEAAIDWMNERFLEDLSTDVKRGLKHLVTQYGAVPGTPPRGFKREAVSVGLRRDGRSHIVHRWVPDPDTSPLVLLAFQMRSNGASYDNIRKKTNLYTQKSSWAHFFANRLYTGELIYGDLVISDYCEPIVDRLLWDRVQQVQGVSIVNHNLPTQLHPRRKASHYILSGMVYCAKCGAPMNGETIHSKVKNITNEYYACSVKKRTGACTSRNVPKNTLENAVANSCAEYILNVSSIINLQTAMAETQAEKKAGLEEKLQAYRVELSNINRQINNVTNAIAEASHTSALLKKLDALEHARGDIELEILDLELAASYKVPNLSPDEIERTVTGMVTVLRSADLEKKKEIYASFIDRITVERSDSDTITGTITYFYPLDPAPNSPTRLSHRREQAYNLNSVSFTVI